MELKEGLTIRLLKRLLKHNASRIRGFGLAFDNAISLLLKSANR
jgi:hypothetical protein